MKESQWKSPLVGVLGVVSEGSPEEAERLRRAREAGLGGVEVRADLLLEAGLERDAVVGRVAGLVADGVPVLFTVRRAEQRGAWQQDEGARVALYRDALAVGASAIDVEWGTPAAVELAAGSAPIVLSEHRFDAMLSERELDELGAAMSSTGALAVKVVPHAETLSDSLRMLDWVARRPHGAPARVGFAMGDRGVAGRILSLSRGAPFTYACLGAPVAPGQLAALELLEVYAPQRLGRAPTVYGVVGARALDSFSPYLHNPALRARSIDAVYLPFQIAAFDEIPPVLDGLRIEGLSVTIPFKQDACRFAGTLDARSAASGAVNTLCIRRDPIAPAGGIARGFNTDYEGVIQPLQRRLEKLGGVDVAVIGNGGAARGAVLALKDAGAAPAIYYRNIERGEPVAAALGVPGRPLDALAGDAPRVIINATPLGSSPLDPSPVPAAVFAAKREPRIAFEMVYEPAETQFLRDARAAGAELIRGSEMLVAQGVAQFVHFTGARPTVEEFEASYRAGEAIRRAARS